MPRSPRTPGPKDRVRAEHMLQLAREAVAEFAEIDEAAFLKRRVFQTSLAWYLQAIGEAAARVSDESRALCPEVPWRKIVGTRHILSHEYDRLMPEKLWNVLRTHLPPLITTLERQESTGFRERRADAKETHSPTRITTLIPSPEIIVRNPSANSSSGTSCVMISSSSSRPESSSSSI